MRIFFLKRYLNRVQTYFLESDKMFEVHITNTILIFKMLIVFCESIRKSDTLCLCRQKY